VASAAEITRVRRDTERDSAARAKSATRAPTPATARRGTGVAAGGSTEPQAARSAGKVDGGMSQGVLHTAEQEAGIRSKAAGGITITNSDLDYMGHFANDDVTRKGHNVGKKPKGYVGSAEIAKCGYRKLPGSAIHEMGASITTPRVERAAMTTVMSPSPNTPKVRSSKADRIVRPGAPMTAKPIDAGKPPRRRAR
jgi:hypothetical protein